MRVGLIWGSVAAVVLAGGAWLLLRMQPFAADRALMPKGQITANNTLPQGHSHSKAVTGTGTVTPTHQVTTSAPTVVPGHKQKKPTTAEIAAPYISRLQALQSQYLGELTAIYNQAKATYHTKGTAKPLIEVQYLPKFISLQNSLQDQVNGLLFSLRTQLTVHGYSTREVEVLHGEYEQAMAQVMATFK